jgi:hypothetical protein
MAISLKKIGGQIESKLLKSTKNGSTFDMIFIVSINSSAVNVNKKIFLEQHKGLCLV